MNHLNLHKSNKSLHCLNFVFSETKKLGKNPIFSADFVKHMFEQIIVENGSSELVLKHFSENFYLSYPIEERDCIVVCDAMDDIIIDPLNFHNQLFELYTSFCKTTNSNEHVFFPLLQILLYYVYYHHRNCF